MVAVPGLRLGRCVPTTHFELLWLLLWLCQLLQIVHDSLHIRIVVHGSSRLLGISWRAPEQVGIVYAGLPLRCFDVDRRLGNKARFNVHQLALHFAILEDAFAMVRVFFLDDMVYDAVVFFGR